jgi:hypothetical protein
MCGGGGGGGGGGNSNLKKKRKNDKDHVNQNGKLMRPKLHSPSYTHLVVSRIVLHQEWEGEDYIMHPKKCKGLI